MITVELRDNSVDIVALAVIREIAMATISEVSALLPGLSDDIVLGVGSGDQVIPETGEVGASVEPGRIEWSADPSRPGGIEGVARRQLRPTLFHELHHQARGWVIRGGSRPTSFIEAPVCEGLATAFERDAAGRRPPWAEYPIEVDHWVEELMALPMTADYAEWMFQHPDGRRWIGYRAGTYIADRAMEASELSAAELATTPTAQVLELAGYGSDAR